MVEDVKRERTADRPHWEIFPDFGPYEDGVEGIAAGLTPGQAITVRMSLLDLEGTQWSSQIDTLADSKARLDLSEHRHDFFSALKPLNASPHAYLRGTQGSYGRPVLDQNLGADARIEVLETGTATPLLSHRGRVQRLRKGVAKRDLAKGDVRAALYSPAVDGSLLVVCIPGSGGGMDATFAPALANAGYDVLTPALFSYPGRPDYHDGIALETIGEAIDLARAELGQPDRRIALLGTSRGAEAVLAYASLAERPAAGVMALVPGAVVTPGWSPEAGDLTEPWTWRDQALPYFAEGFETLHDRATPFEDPTLGIESIGFSDFYGTVFRDQTALGKAAVPTDGLEAPILLIAAGDDRIWDSGTGAEDLWTQLPAKVRDDPRSRKVTLDKAGHMIAPLGMPTALSSSVYHPVEKQFYAVGGTPETNAAANAKAWTEIKGFLSKL
ncbi:MAG: alpha/beta fold hydrolase [Pseudomonadota bacterium]